MLLELDTKGGGGNQQLGSSYVDKTEQGTGKALLDGQGYEYQRLDTNETRQDASTVIQNNGYLPQHLVTRALAVIDNAAKYVEGNNVLSKALTRKRPHYQIEKNLDDITDTYFREIIRPRQSLLDSEKVALMQLKAAVGADVRSPLQLPMTDEFNSRAWLTLKSQIDQGQVFRGGPAMPPGPPPGVPPGVPGNPNDGQDGNGQDGGGNVNQVPLVGANGGGGGQGGSGGNYQRPQGRIQIRQPRNQGPPVLALRPPPFQFVPQQALLQGNPQTTGRSTGPGNGGGGGSSSSSSGQNGGDGGNNSSGYRGGGNSSARSFSSISAGGNGSNSNPQSPPDRQPIGYVPSPQSIGLRNLSRPLVFSGAPQYQQQVHSSSSSSNFQQNVPPPPPNPPPSGSRLPFYLPQMTPQQQIEQVQRLGNRQSDEEMKDENPSVPSPPPPPPPSNPPNDPGQAMVQPAPSQSGFVTPPRVQQQARPQSDMSRLFEQLQRAERQRSRNRPQTGASEPLQNEQKDNKEEEKKSNEAVQGGGGSSGNDSGGEEGKGGNRVGKLLNSPSVYDVGKELLQKAVDQGKGSQFVKKLNRRISNLVSKGYTVKEIEEHINKVIDKGNFKVPIPKIRPHKVQ